MPTKGQSGTINFVASNYYFADEHQRSCHVDWQMLEIVLSWQI